MGKILYFGKDFKYSEAKNSRFSKDVEGLNKGAVEKVYKAIQEEAKGKAVDKKIIEKALGNLKGKKDVLSEQKLSEVSKQLTGHSYVLSRGERPVKEENKNMPVGINNKNDGRNMATKNSDIKKANPAPPPMKLVA